MRNQILRDGLRTNRFIFVADAAMRLAAATEAGTDGGFEIEHISRAVWALDAAEALWDELCKRFPDDAPNEPRGEDMWVVFDGPPSHESGRFVEVEDAGGKGVISGADWGERPDGLWRLGPFYRAPRDK